MKRPVYIVCLVLVGVIAVSIWWIVDGKLPQVGTASAGALPLSNDAVQNAASSAGGRSALKPDEISRAVPQTSDGIAVMADVAETARSLHSPEATVENDLEILQAIVDVYRRANNGVGPGGGLNEEIVGELRGENSRRFAVFPPEHPSLDAQGQLLDRWQTPYFFHPVSASQMEIRSAGPDRKLWTEDDVAIGETKEELTLASGE